MNQLLVDKIVQAVLYEGYILYPYRPSVKNHHRWTFGGLFPRAYVEANPFGDAWSLQAQCLVLGNDETVLDARTRFLHLTDRKVGQFLQPIAKLSETFEPACLPVASMEVNGKQYRRWQEAVERDIPMAHATLGELRDRPRSCEFAFPISRKTEPLVESDGQIVGILAREQQAIEGTIELSAMKIADGVYRITVAIWNRTPIGDVTLARHAHESGTASSFHPSPAVPPRDEALMRSLVSTHAILAVQDGRFVSMTDPPAHLQEAVAECRNIGVWPVLVGETGEADAILASPIILYDYPQIAPESPGDLFDGTEIDEILTLRVLTLTDDEKREVAAIDDKAGAMLKRTEALAREQLMALHGTVRGLRPFSPQEDSPPLQARLADDVITGRDVRPALNSPPARESKFGLDALPAGDVLPAWDVMENKPKLPSFTAGGIELRPGDRVRLRPGGRADAFDMLLAGKSATIASIEQDYEDRVHIAVTIDDDPGADFGVQGKPGHRFFFKPEEVELIESTSQLEKKIQ